MYKIYQVEGNETLEEIADKFHTTVSDLKQINGFDGSQIKENQYIIVPFYEQVLFDNYIIQKGDTIYEIARKYEVLPENLLKLNGLSKDEYIYPDEKILVPKKNIKFYVTEEGDSIESVMNRLDTDIEKILNQNRNILVLPEQLVVIKRDEIQ